MSIAPGRSGPCALACATLLSGALALPAGAEESPYCRKVRARASEDAALLSWPRLVGEVHRFPAGASMGPTVGDTGAQVRLGISFSPTDLWRGLLLEDAAGADCDLQEASQGILVLVAGAQDAAVQRALAAQVAALASQRTEWAVVLEQARARLAAGLITVTELQELRRLVVQLERKLEYAAGEEARLRARTLPEPQAGSPDPAGSMDRLVRSYAQRAGAAEQASARARGFEAVRVGLTGGAVPSFGSSSSDWYAAVEISLNLGLFSRAGAAGRGRAARQDEVARARYELPARLDELRQGMRAQAQRTRRELEVVQREIASVRATRDVLGDRHSGGADQARAVLALELAGLEADAAYLARLSGSLDALAE